VNGVSHALDLHDKAMATIAGMTITAGSRYVAMGSSYAAGPQLRPRSPHSPLRAARSDSNYAHLLARRLDLDLTDVSYSGATAAQMIDGRSGRPAQVEAVTAETQLVTLTCGGNDVGYIGRLIMAQFAAAVPVLTAAAAVHQRCGRFLRFALRAASGHFRQVAGRGTSARARGHCRLG
jgi:hypothetical protein